MATSQEAMRTYRQDERRGGGRGGPGRRGRRGRDFRTDWLMRCAMPATVAHVNEGDSYATRGELRSGLQDGYGRDSRGSQGECGGYVEYGKHEALPRPQDWQAKAAFTGMSCTGSRLIR
ncbi:hypothetical protein DDE01_15750 [Desulfovibrio desulfuricans]|nr:hypothetical protein DDE01_15750 [Desulfovibrio desulfuricans]